MARYDSRNRTRYWCDPHIRGVSLLRAEFTTFPYVPHIHDTYVIAVTEAGGASITCRGQTKDAAPSTIFLSNPLEPQAASVPRSGRWRYRAFYLSDLAASSIANELGLDELPSFVTPVRTDAAVAEQILSLHRWLDEGTEDVAENQTRLLDVMGSLIAQYGAVRTPSVRAYDAVVRQAMVVMRDRYTERLHLTDLSDPVGVSPFQLITLFKRAVGMTPYAYLTQVRLHAARQYLASGRPISYGALAAGFYDQSAFTRHFKRSYGITPLQFATAEKAGI